MVHNKRMSVLFRRRRVASMIFMLVFFAYVIVVNFKVADSEVIVKTSGGVLASKVLGSLPVKARAESGEYAREQFGADWISISGCNTRNIILNRDLKSTVVDDVCNVLSGVLDDPYSGKVIEFKRGSSSSSLVQIDHVVALSDAWQKGAQDMTKEKRIELANDALELLAVGGTANQQKSGSDAASWLPSFIPFRCQYVARQIAVKQKYKLWVTSAERDAISAVLSRCPNETLPNP
jgi:hypothetical protein